MGEDRRQEMMQNLFGDDQSEDEVEVESDNEVNHQPAYVSDEGEVEVEEGEGEGEGEVEVEEGEGEGEGEAEYDGTVEGEVEGEGEVESEGERPDSEPEREEVEAERSQSSQEREYSAQRESEGREHGSDFEAYDAREATSRRQAVSPSISERSPQPKGVEEDEDEVDQVRHDDDQHVTQTADMHDVFGYSDDEQPEYAAQHSPEQSAGRLVSDEEGSEQRGIHPEDVVPDEEGHYDSEDEQQYEQKTKERPVGPPLELEFPIRRPPGPSEKMNLIRVSNIMGIEAKPFDPKTYVEEEDIETDEPEARKKIRLEDNIARWRKVQNRNGTFSYESNARFVKWSDGSMQLLIGNEVLDLSVQDARADNLHLFLRHGKGILQSQGKLVQKMRFVPSSLSSKSHRLLTALVDSRHKKSNKIKNFHTTVDPEREKEEKEKAQEQRIRSREDLHRKQEKINRKYMPAREREPQLSPGYLEDALDEENEAPENHRASRARRFEERERENARRIMNAKRQPPLPRERVSKFPKDRRAARPSRPSRREYEDVVSEESEREVSEYETDGAEDEEPEQEDAEYQEAEEEEADEPQDEEEEQVEERYSEEDDVGEKSRKRQERDESPMEESPPRKAVQRRRVVVSESEED